MRNFGWNCTELITMGQLGPAQLSCMWHSWIALDFQVFIPWHEYNIRHDKIQEIPSICMRLCHCTSTVCVYISCSLLDCGGSRFVILNEQWYFNWKPEGSLSWPRTTVCSGRLRVRNCATTLGPQEIYPAPPGPVGISPAQCTGTPAVIKKKWYFNRLMSPDFSYCGGMVIWNE